MAVATGSSSAVSGLNSVLSPTPRKFTESLLLTLEVTRGQTMFPHRPVTGPRFLIGSGVGCHLRLGGPDLPTLHSLIVIVGTEVTLEAIAAEPPLKVNGRKVTTALITHGDRIEIGPFHFTVRVIPPHAALQPEVEMPLSRHADDDREPADLSALELVERMEDELRMIEEFDSRREQGAAALLDAVERRHAEPFVQTQEPALAKTDRVWRVDGAGMSSHPHIPAVPLTQPVAETDEMLVHDLQRLQDDLQRFSRLLEARAERLSQQEANVADAATELVEAQQHLSQQLDLLMSQARSHAEAPHAAETLVRAIA